VRPGPRPIRGMMAPGSSAPASPSSAARTSLKYPSGPSAAANRGSPGSGRAWPRSPAPGRQWRTTAPIAAHPRARLARLQGPTGGGRQGRPAADRDPERAGIADAVLDFYHRAELNDGAHRRGGARGAQKIERSTAEARATDRHPAGVEGEVKAALEHGA